MPSSAAVLTDRQIAKLASHIRTSWGNRATVVATAEMVTAARPLVGAPARSLASSALCPAVPAERMDAATRSAIAALGPAPKAEALAPVAQAYDVAIRSFRPRSASSR